jgi:hypothetical protein
LIVNRNFFIPRKVNIKSSSKTIILLEEATNLPFVNTFHETIRVLEMLRPDHTLQTGPRPVHQHP